MSLFGETGAIFSKDNRHRYLLWRTWGNDMETPLLCFIGLNPSTADAHNDDATIRRCVGFAKQWGYRGIYMANLFSIISTSPITLNHSPDKIRDYTDHYLKLIVSPLFDVVFAWGDTKFSARREEVISMFPDAKCLEFTKAGHPHHPLYLKADLKLKNFFPRRLTDDQIIACAIFYLDYHNPMIDQVPDLAEKMDMEYDDETDLWIDHEGVYERYKPEIINY